MSFYTVQSGYWYRRENKPENRRRTTIAALTLNKGSGITQLV
jgi:hypothetical protein